MLKKGVLCIALLLAIGGGTAAWLYDQQRQETADRRYFEALYLRDILHGCEKCRYADLGDWRCFTRPELRDIRDSLIAAAEQIIMPAESNLPEWKLALFDRAAKFIHRVPLAAVDNLLATYDERNAEYLATYRHTANLPLSCMDAY